MPGLPADVRMGDAIRARDWNAVLEVVEQLTRRLEKLEGVARDAAAGLDTMVMGYVVAVTDAAGRDLAAGVPVAPSVIRYTVRPLGCPATGECDVARAVPRWGRPVVGDTAKVVPAAVGSEAIVWRYPDGEGGWLSRVMVCEGLKFGGC